MRNYRRIQHVLLIAVLVLGLDTATTQAQANKRIHDITGNTYLSPLADQHVTDVPGIVTAISGKGFFMQDPSPDSDIATSEGIYVYAGRTPTVSVGDSVLVSGTVQEFRPGKNDANTLAVTEIAGKPTVKALSSGNALPLPVVMGIGGRAVPTKVLSRVSGDVEKSDTFDPIYAGLDYYRSLEGMLVQVNNAVVVGPTNKYGEVVVLSDNGSQAIGRAPRGCPVHTADTVNPERIILDNSIYKTLFSNQSFGTLNVGDKFNSPVVGVLDYNFDTFRILVTKPVTTASGGLQRQVAAKPRPDQLTVATFNVENLSPSDPQQKYDRLAGLIVNNLRSPDILTVEEIQDQSGAQDDGTVDASGTFGKLIASIKAANGPTYDYRQIDPVNDQDGGQPGGNIRQGFLFNPARVTFTERPGATSTATDNVIHDPANPDHAQLAFSPGRIDPQNSVWQDSRKPLVGEFMFNAHRLFVIGNHFVAKLGDQPDFGRYQPPKEVSSQQRVKQAEVVNSFVQQILAIEPNANIVLLGDMNDADYSLPVLTLAGKELYPLMSQLSKFERYSYDFQGNCEVLDQILVSFSLLHNADVQYEVVHVNAEFADQASDHDPSVARLSLPK